MYHQTVQQFRCGVTLALAITCIVPACAHRPEVHIRNHTQKTLDIQCMRPVATYQVNIGPMHYSLLLRPGQEWSSASALDSEVVEYELRNANGVYVLVLRRIGEDAAERASFDIEDNPSSRDLLISIFDARNLDEFDIKAESILNSGDRTEARVTRSNVVWINDVPQ